MAARKLGYEDGDDQTQPETVSTELRQQRLLFFEPLTHEVY
jgi:hypothetical protein